MSDHPLKKLRLDRGLTQEALSKELGVAQVTICRWEKRTRTPRRRQASEIAAKLGLSEAEVMGYAKEVA